MDLGLTIVEVDQFCEGSLRQKKKLKRYVETRSISGKQNSLVVVCPIQPHAQPQPQFCAIITASNYCNYSQRPLIA
jgi:hypothetical protein